MKNVSKNGKIIAIESADAFVGKQVADRVTQILSSTRNVKSLSQNQLIEKETNAVPIIKKVLEMVRTLKKAKRLANSHDVVITNCLMPIINLSKRMPLINITNIILKDALQKDDVSLAAYIGTPIGDSLDYAGYRVFNNISYRESVNIEYNIDSGVEKIAGDIVKKLLTLESI